MKVPKLAVGGKTYFNTPNSFGFFCLLLPGLFVRKKNTRLKESTLDFYCDLKLRLYHLGTTPATISWSFSTGPKLTAAARYSWNLAFHVTAKTFETRTLSNPALQLDEKKELRVPKRALAGGQGLATLPGVEAS